jgi:hypothetical protein
MKNRIIQVLCSSPYGCSEFINVMVPFVEILGSAPLVCNIRRSGLLHDPGENRMLSRAVTGYGFWELICSLHQHYARHCALFDTHLYDVSVVYCTDFYMRFVAVTPKGLL